MGLNSNTTDYNWVKGRSDVAKREAVVSGNDQSLSFSYLRSISRVNVDIGMRLRDSHSFSQYTVPKSAVNIVPCGSGCGLKAPSPLL